MCSERGVCMAKGGVCAKGLCLAREGMCGREEDIHGRGPCMARGACILLECILVLG